MQMHAKWRHWYRKDYEKEKEHVREDDHVRDLDDVRKHVRDVTADTIGFKPDNREPF